MIGKIIVSLFGEKVITEGTINRTLIAEAVRANPQLLDRLETICHPYINEEILREYQEASQEKPDGLFVVEIPLLFESRFPLTAWFDSIIGVIADEKKAKERYVRRGGTEEQFLFRRARQLKTEELMRKADYVLFNNGTIKELTSEAKNCMDSFAKASK